MIIEEIKNKVILGDAIELLVELPSNSVDALITDPPYGMKVASWDEKIDTREFTRQVRRVCKGFYAFFGQMPYVLNWLSDASEEFHFFEHITWVKRNTVPIGSNRLHRSHEEIFIFGNKGQKFHNVRGLYQDVKLPGILVDTASIESVDRYISDLIYRIKNNRWRTNLGGGKSQLMFGKQRNFGDYQAQIDRNFTNVWSFLPPTKSVGRAGSSNYLHPSEKPLEVMRRLVEMCTQPGQLILDPFLGSGTTAVAAAELGRNYLGFEISADYIQLAQSRLENASICDSETILEQPTLV